MQKTKICTKCEEVKALQLFNKCKQSKSGYRSQCKDCIAKSRRIYEQKNKEKISKRKKLYGEQNKREISEQKKCYAQENKEAISERRRLYYVENKEGINKQQKDYRSRNKDKIEARMSVYRENNPHIQMGCTQRYIARKKGLPDNLTPSDWDEVMNEFGHRCSYCGMSEKEHREKFNQRLEQEHFIPLSKGGEYTHNNIIVACRSCNSSKGNKDFFKWYPTYEHYNKEREQKILEFLGYKDNTQQLSIL